jgi:hypothetical protein
MPAVDLRKINRQPGSRVAIFGAPNTLKTTAMLTWPKPLVILLYPGEKGWDTIPRDRDDIIPLIWEIDPEKASWSQLCSEVEKTTWRAIAGEFTGGKQPQTLALDGLHKLYHCYLKREFTDLVLAAQSNARSNQDPEAYRGPSYGRAHDVFGHYVTKTLQSSVPWIVASLWEGRIKDNPDDTTRTAKRHIFPDLPGEMGKNIVGEFASGILYSEVGLPDPLGRVKGTWLTKKSGDIWGVGLKCPAEIAERIPARIPQTWEALTKALSGKP